MTAFEVNFDGLVGPTHNYGGLAHGNLAAAKNEGQVSNPKEAALQGLAKMRLMLSLGLKQGVLPPHERPHIPSLRRMGFSGTDVEIVSLAARANPVLLTNLSSASAMWTANAATVTPSADASDGRVHITPANLSSHFHRALEAETTTNILRRIFADPRAFRVHDPVPFPHFGDEGAANHCRLSKAHGERGVEVFVYGQSAFGEKTQGRFSARQAVEASHIVMTHHGLGAGGVLLAQQARAAIDAGAFHNDVVSVSNETVLMHHELAFENHAAFADALRRACEPLGFEPVLYGAPAAELSLAEAVSSYVFNSQIVTLPDGTMTLILPVETEETPAAKAYVDGILASNGPIRSARYVDLRQSMRNGGGPACLRLRVVLTEPELDRLGASVLLDEARIGELEAVVQRRYRDRLSPSDLGDPQLLDDSRAALDEFSRILGLEGVYDFQRA
ncbi:MAG: N-succinylarginine dihydrolase [Hyphomonadaceae bacterium]